LYSRARSLACSHSGDASSFARAAAAAAGVGPDLTILPDDPPFADFGYA